MKMIYTLCAHDACFARLNTFLREISFNNGRPTTLSADNVIDDVQLCD